jgi:hypothetical protein
MKEAWCLCGNKMEEIEVGDGVSKLYHCQKCGRLLSIGAEGQQGWIEHDQVPEIKKKGIKYLLTVSAAIELVAPNIDSVTEYMYKNICIMDGNHKMDAFHEDVRFEIMPK